MVLDDGTIELPIKFTAEKAGHYPCKIILEAADDIRVYQVECTVNPPGCRYDHYLVIAVNPAVQYVYIAIWYLLIEVNCC